MFGIGFPELILIMALALIVVGPEKLPELAKTLAKQLLELKKTANALKEALQEELKAEEQRDNPALPSSKTEQGETAQQRPAEVIDVEARPVDTPPAQGNKSAAEEAGPPHEVKKKS